MRRVLSALCLLIFLLLCFLPKPVFAQPGPVNLLQNPGFEGNYFAWRGIPEVQVAHGWTPWWRVRTEADAAAYYFKPEYKQANGYIYPNRVHSGAAAQQWFTFFATHQAGMYQQVFGVTPGSRYRFTIWAQVWSSTDNDPNFSRNPAYPNLQVGIDPTGSWNPWAGTVVWSGTYVFYDTWGQLAVEAVAANTVITVFTRSEPNFPVKHNDMYWDDAALLAVGPGNALFQPTATAVPPPSDTVTPAETPAPTPTCSPPPVDWVSYYVQRGDTLYNLSKRTGTTVEMIMSANCLQTTTIYVGQELLLPKLPPTLTPTKRIPTSTPVAPTATAQPTETAAATAPSSPTATTPPDTATAEPTATVVPATATPVPSTATAQPTAVPATSTMAPPPTVEVTSTPTKPPPTIPPPATPTAGQLVSPPTSTPSGATTRPCGTIVLGGSVVLLAGFFRFRRRNEVV